MCGEANYQAMIASLWMETFTYGIYALLFAGNVHVYVNDPGHRNLRLFMASTALFFVSTVHIVLDALNVIIAPNYVRGTLCAGFSCKACPGYADTWAGEASLIDALTSAANVTFLACMILSDGLLIYRCLMVWGGKSRVITLPIIMLLANAAVQCVVIFVHVKGTTAQPVNKPSSDLMVEDITSSESTIIENLQTARMALSVSTNALVTGLIAFRIWRIDRQLRLHLGKQAKSRYSSAILVVIESGAMMCITELLRLLFTIYHKVFQVNDGRTYEFDQFMGISATLITVRVALQKGVEHTLLNQTGDTTELHPTDQEMTFAPNPEFTNGAPKEPLKTTRTEMA